MTSWRYSGRRDSNTGLAKVTTNYKALPCSPPVSAARGAQDAVPAHASALHAGAERTSGCLSRAEWPLAGRWWQRELLSWAPPYDKCTSSRAEAGSPY